MAQGVQTRVHRYILDPWQDRRLAINAAGRHQPGELLLEGWSAQQATEYFGSPSWVVDRALEGLNLDLSRFVFIDFGCGKGRVLLRAAMRPFRRVEGIELSRPMYEIALTNIGRAKESGRVRAPVVAHHSDVLKYDLPTEPLILYMFNSFGEAVVRQLLEKLHLSLRKQPRDCHFIYLNPVHKNQFVHCPLLQEMPKSNFTKMLDALISPWPLATYRTRSIAEHHERLTNRKG
jgi:cyclopropane fatty-acyl-phospholipid synthase-like methyltransferase